MRVDLVPIGVPATSTALPTTSIPSTPTGCWSSSPPSKESSRVTESMKGEESGARSRSSSFPPFVILQQQPCSHFSHLAHLSTTLDTCFLILDVSFTDSSVIGVAPWFSRPGWVVQCIKIQFIRLLENPIPRPRPSL